MNTLKKLAWFLLVFAIIAGIFGSIFTALALHVSTVQFLFTLAAAIAAVPTLIRAINKLME